MRCSNFTPLRWFAGVLVAAGKIRHIRLEAEDLAEAESLAGPWNVGIEGEAAVFDLAAQPPEAYDVKSACVMLGGISRTTLYKELLLGHLARVPDTRRVLITRASILRRCRSA